MPTRKSIFLLFTKYPLHVSARTAPSSGRTLYHFSEPSAYREVVTKLFTIIIAILALFNSTLPYHSETWVNTKRDVTGLEAAQMRFVRNVKGYTRLDKIRSEAT
jgi:hypothetical protein